MAVTRSPEDLGKICQIVFSIAFSVGQHRQEPRAGFPDDFAPLIEAAKGISATFVLLQDLGKQLTPGEVGMIRFYLLDGYIDPELQDVVHSEFHNNLPAPEDALKLRRRVH